MSQYPTKEEILTNPPKIKEGTMQVVKAWKEHWKQVRKGTPEQKFDALKTLIEHLAESYDKPVPHVSWEPYIPSCCYRPMTNTISINSSLSVISALHETAHMLFGASEKQACRWSVAIFREAFPRAYDKLQWRGHLLVRANS